MTTQDWQQLPIGTKVRWWPGGRKGPAPAGAKPRYVDTKIKRRPYRLGSGTLVVPLDGFTEAKPVGELEVVPQATETAAMGVSSVHPYGFAGP